MWISKIVKEKKKERRSKRKRKERRVCKSDGCVMAERENKRSAQIVASRKTFRVFFARDDYFFKKEEKKKAIRRDREGERSRVAFLNIVCAFLKRAEYA